MSQQIPGTNSERDSDNPPAVGADYKDDNQDFGYLESLSCGEYPYSTSFVPFHQPIVDHNHALLSQQVAQTNGDLPYAQAEHDAGPQYPYQINPWNDAAFDVYHPETCNPNAVLYNTSLNFPYDGIETQLAPQLPSVHHPHYVYDYGQLMMPTIEIIQPIPSVHPTPVPAGPPVPTPAPAPSTNAASIRCPEGCPETFGRNEEMRRHMRKHQEPRFKCPIYNCPMTFYRKDKLQDHAKKGHRGRDVLNIC